MRVLIQRVTQAALTIDNALFSSINKGLVALVGIEAEDTTDDIEWLAAKMVKLRIFDDEQGIMNLDIRQTEGEIMLVSQFTLHASTKKGNRPSYIRAAGEAIARPLYEEFITRLSAHLGKEVQTGEFGADMQINLTNDGPVTIWIDSKNRE